MIICCRFYGFIPFNLCLIFCYFKISYSQINTDYSITSFSPSFEVPMIYSLIYGFAVDVSSFHIEEQKDLHRSNMVQGSSILSCKFWSHFKYCLIFWYF